MTRLMIKHEIPALIAGGLLFSVFIFSGPTTLASLVVKFLPVTLMLLSIYLVLCSLISRIESSKGCFGATIINRYGFSTNLWVFLSFIIIGSQLVITWSGNAPSFFYMGGILPNSDANNYYKGARKLLIEGVLPEWSARRPFMTTYISSFLALFTFSLSKAIAAISIITALVLALFGATLRNTEPLPVAIWAFILVVIFYLSFVGTTLSENLGLSFGAIAFVLLWFSAVEKKVLLFLLGIYFMALAQVTRSGAVFVLPALIIWGTFWLSIDTRHKVIIFISACFAVIGGFLSNRLLLDLGVTGEEIGFSNFSYTIYGLSVGHGGWSQILKDHPEIVALSEPARSQGIYTLALQNILNEPLDLISALLRNIQAYTVVNGGLNIMAGNKAWLLVQLPTIGGVIWCLRYIKTPRYALLLAVFSGVLFSSMVITEDGGLRVFAATVPFSAAIAAIGLNFLLKNNETFIDEGESLNRSPVIFAGFMGFIIVASVILTISFAPISEIRNVTEKKCGTGERLLNVHYPARTAIHLSTSKKDFESDIPSLSLDKFKGTLRVNGRRRDWPDVNLKDGSYSIVSVGKYVLIPSGLIKDDPPVVTVCVTRHRWLFISNDLFL